MDYKYEKCSECEELIELEYPEEYDLENYESVNLLCDKCLLLMEE